MFSSLTALLNIGGQEMLVLLVIGLLIFGRRLPEVGRSLGKTLAQLRRGLQDFKGQMDRDEDLKDIRGSLREMKRAVEVPRMLASPGRMLRNLTDETLSSPGPDSDAESTGEPAVDSDVDPTGDPVEDSSTGETSEAVDFPEAADESETPAPPPVDEPEAKPS